MAKKGTTTPTIEASEITSSTYADSFIDKLDYAKIERLEQEVKDLKDKNSKKVYAIKISTELLISLMDFIETEAEWAQTEALGVIEISKLLKATKKEGVKDNTIFLEALPLEATHYFLSKTKGKGLKQAESFISLYKPFSMALEEVKKDAAAVQDLEKELAAAQQGIEAV